MKFCLLLLATSLTPCQLNSRIHCLIVPRDLIQNILLKQLLPANSNIACYFSKVSNFSYTPHVLGVPVVSDLFEISPASFASETSILGYRCGVVCLAVLIKPQLVTDTQKHRKMDTKP